MSSLGSPVPLHLIPRPQVVTWSAGEGAIDPVREAPMTSALPAGRGDIYTLDVGPSGAVLSAAGEEGRRYGQATLAQLRRPLLDGGLAGGLRIRDYAALPVRALHLDLKLHPPRFEWTLGWLEQLAAWKLNMLVVEYEDRFPYEKVRHVAHASAWSRDQVREFVAKASGLGIQIVPLVQCLGHVEYVLWHKEYAHLRELPDEISQYCPANAGAFEQFTAMASEVLELHPGASYLHVGGDETSFLGRCPVCAARARQTSEVTVYVEHVRKVCAWVADQGLRPLLWDDILRKEPALIRELPRATVLVHWDYGATGLPIDRRKPREGGTWAELLSGAPTAEPPYLGYRKEGYDVLMAPSYAGGQLVPLANADNCRYFAQQAALHNCLGVCSTHWACFFTPPAVCDYGAAATADSAWNPLPSRDDTLTVCHQGAGVEFDRRFCQAAFGLPDETLIHALRLLSTGPMYVPHKGRGYPTYFAEPTSVDMSFDRSREQMAAYMAAFFRPDWDTPVSGFTFEQGWQAKLAAIRGEPGLEHIKTTVRDLLARNMRGLELLAGESRRARRGRELLEGLEIGARIRVWRVEHLLHALGAGPPPEPRPDLKERLIAFHSRCISEPDARQMVGWMCAGL